MKKLFLFSILFMVVGIQSCKKRDAYAAHFFQSDGASKRYTLKIDGVDEGKLPYKPAFVESCPESTDTTCLHLQLYEGRYKYEVLDEAGNTISEGKFKATDRTTSNSGIVGYSQIKFTEDCGIFCFGQ